MKRILLILLSLGLFLGACSSRHTEPEGIPLDFYYPAEDPYAKGSFLAVRQYYQDSLPAARTLVERYLAAPIPDNGREAIPRSWKLGSAELQEDGTFVVVFTGLKADAVQEAVAAACLAKTLSQLDSVLRLQLCPPGKAEPLTLSANDVLLEDLSMQPQKTELILYYPDAQRRFLRRESRMVEDMQPEELPKLIVQQLLQGTAIGEEHSCIPRGTELLGLDVHNGICTVILSSDFTRNMPEEFSVVRLAVYSIVNSLTELDHIHTVELQVAYAPLERLYMMDLSGGVSRDESLLYQEDAFEISLYPQIGETGELVEIPYLLTRDESIGQEEQVIRTLLSYEGANGIAATIPEGTSLLSVRVADGLCMVDLTAGFLGKNVTGDMEETAVKSIVATLCALPTVDTVEILVEGLSPEYRNRELQKIHTVDPDWICQ